MKIFVFLLFLSTYSYAIIRYHLGKEIPCEEWYFVLNKAMAWTGFTLTALTILKNSTLKKFNLNRKQLGITGYLFLLSHLISVLILLSERHYPKLFTDGSLNILGWLSLGLGVLTLLIFTFPLIASLTNKSSDSNFFRIGKYGVALSLLHPSLIGFSGWIKPEEWPYFMPPITLLAVLTGFLLFSVRWKKLKE